MIKRNLALKCGKTLTIPAFLLQPYHHEGRIVRETILGYPPEATGELAGVVNSMKDWPRVRESLYPKTLDNDKRDLLELRLSSGRLGDAKVSGERGNLREAVARVASSDQGDRRVKSSRYVEEVYPFLESLAYDVIKYLIDAGTDILIAPSVPITSKPIALRQIQKHEQMVRHSRALFRSVFSRVASDLDFMSMITINAHILESRDTSQRLIDSIIESQPDHVGVKVLNLDERETARVEAVLRFVADLRRALDYEGAHIPIHLFNVREFGYVTFCHGVSAITSPIARKPYVYLNPANPPDSSPVGKYTHPSDLVDYTYEHLQELTESVGYQLPCHCHACRERVVVGSRDDFNVFRKKHFIAYKGGLEMQEIRRADPATLNVALRDRFARSKQTGLIAYLDQIVHLPL
jgi:hypothetical protein